MVNGRESQEGGCTRQPTSWHQGKVFLLPPPESLRVKQVHKGRLFMLVLSAVVSMFEVSQVAAQEVQAHIPVRAYFSWVGTASPQASSSHSKRTHSEIITSDTVANDLKVMGCWATPRHQRCVGAKAWVRQDL